MSGSLYYKKVAGAVETNPLSSDLLWTQKADGSTPGKVISTNNLIGGFIAETEGKLPGLFLDNEVYKHPRGDAEYVGDADYYGTVGSGVGYNAIRDGIGLPIMIKKIQVALSKHDATSVYQVRVYKRTGALASGDKTSTLTLVQSYDFAADALTASTSLLTLELTTQLLLLPTEYLYVLAKKVSGSNPHLRRWTTESSTPARNRILLSTSADPFDPDGVWGYGSSGYYSVPLILTMNFPTQTTLGYITDVDNPLITKDSLAKIKGGYIPKEQYKHSRGDSEYEGNSTYQYAGVALYSQLENDAVFNKVKIRLYGDSTTAAEVRVYTADRKTSNFAMMTLLQTTIIAAGEINKITAGFQEIILTNPAFSKSGTWIYAFVAKTAGTNPTMRRLTSLFGGLPERNQLLLSATGSFSANWTYAGDNSYLTTPVLLEFDTLYDTEIRPLPQLALPANIYCAVDRELNIWNDALSLVYGDDVNINFICSLGKGKQRGFRYSPTTTASAARLAVTVTDTNGNILEKKSTTLNTVAKATGTGTKQCMFIGDSLTAGGGIHTEFKSLVETDSDMEITLLGTQGTAPNLHEGYGGLTFASFVGESSPFYIGGKLDLQAYMSAHSFTGNLDYAFIQLGVNDVFSGASTTATIATIIANAKTLIDAILDETTGYPDCKIILGLSPISGNTNDGFATNYGASTDRKQYEKNMRMLWKTMITEFDAGVYSANVIISINGLMVDRLYGYALANENVSARNTTQIAAHTNGVHPTTSGYMQIADAYYNAFRSLI